jgi:cobalt/nickel transport system permease protein
MPLAGYATYRALARHASLTGRRRAIAAGIGGYVGLNVAAMCAAVELGLQPALFTDGNGTPLYAPFHLSQTIPAMALAHVLVAGVVELALTAGVIAYLQRANVPILRINHPDVPQTDDEVLASTRPPSWRWALIGLGTMLVLTPLGLLAPGGAFGEDAPADLDLQRYHLDAVPRGLAHYGGFWHNAFFNGYDFTNDAHPTIGYLVSAVAGTLLVAALAFASVKFVQVLRRSSVHA